MSKTETKIQNDHEEAAKPAGYEPEGGFPEAKPKGTWPHQTTPEEAAEAQAAARPDVAMGKPATGQAAKIVAQSAEVPKSDVAKALLAVADELQTWHDRGESGSGSRCDMAVIPEVIGLLKNKAASA